MAPKLSTAPKVGQALKDPLWMRVEGAREHNLRNLDLEVPRYALVVITGLSGSGKSSLAFDTIYAEGQRRYLETLSAYSRQFLGGLERPDVDVIEGLGPVVAIEQKTTGRNPRSTVGTVTEIYDFFRLLYARMGRARSYVTGKPMTRMDENQMLEKILQDFEGKFITLLAPLVKGRKGHYRELFEQLRKQGYLKVRVDGEVRELEARMQVDRYKVHDIDLCLDTLEVGPEEKNRVLRSLRQALKLGNGLVRVLSGQGAQSHVLSLSRYLMCADSGISYEEPEPNSFSFNSPYGACPECNGLGTVNKADLSKLVPDPQKSIAQGAIEPLGKKSRSWTFLLLESLAKQSGFSLDSPFRDLGPAQVQEILYGVDDPLPVVQTYGSAGAHTYHIRFQGVLQYLQDQDDNRNTQDRTAQAFIVPEICPSCSGTRLKKESLHFFVGEKNIGELSQMELPELMQWVQDLDRQDLTQREQAIALDLLKEIKTRLQFLLDVGLDYLTLDRPAGSLSGGEAQRIRLATQIGSGLVNVLYILDEPSIGLHQRDNQRLINSLQALRDMGNSVMVVEHDKEMILAADWVVDMGPGAGRHGGELVAQGPPEEILKAKGLTPDYLNGRRQIEIPRKLRPGNGKFLELKGASGHNLQKPELRIPLGCFVAVSGVSGSGKSSLITQTLYPALSGHIYGSQARPLPYRELKGLEHLDKVIEIDQSPIGRTPRSNPATYTGAFTVIRNLFTALPESKIRGYKPGRFSFNVKGGRCETCQGGGVQVIEMNFLPDVEVPCPTCGGRRYNRETLEVRYKGKSIHDVLDMPVTEALDFFESIPQLKAKLFTLEQVGLGYLRLGQSSTTLSGGEAQRVKLSAELSKRDTGKTFYILDEPTTGLHFEDIRVLLQVLQKLVDRGNTVLVIEHNLDVLKVADHLIDLGPEGGKGGGRIVYQGPPSQIGKAKESVTAPFLLTEMGLRP